MRYFFEIAYHGKNYAGWQNQANATGIQSVIENALSQIFRTGIKIVASGRTDTGVHCEQQFFHCDIEKGFEFTDLIIKLNSFLPKDIVVKAIRKVNHPPCSNLSRFETKNNPSTEKNTIPNKRLR